MLLQEDVGFAFATLSRRAATSVEESLYLMCVVMVAGVVK